MKHFLVIFMVSSFLFMFSCSPEPATKKPKKTEKTNQVKSGKKTAPKKKAKEKMPANYWTALKQNTSIGDDQVKQLQNLDVKYREKRKAVPIDDNKKEALAKLSSDKEAEEKQILGEALWAEKETFGKKWRRVKRERNKNKK